jgi:hypothetical protein
LVWAGETVTLDGTRSWTRAGNGLRFEWAFSDGSTASGATAERIYESPGSYSEVLKVIDANGLVDYDFAVVQVIDRDHPDRLPPSIHAAYGPTFGIRTHEPVTFKVRTFRTGGGETWDFGDGSPLVQVKSDGNAVKLAEDGYAVTTHRFTSSGHKIVRVEHTAENGMQASAHLHVVVEP